MSPRNRYTCSGVVISTHWGRIASRCVTSPNIVVCALLSCFMSRVSWKLIHRHLTIEQRHCQWRHDTQRRILRGCEGDRLANAASLRSEEHTSELQSHSDLVCRLLLEKKKSCNEIQLPDCKRIPS